VLDWPVREGLLAYRERLRAEQRDEWQFEVLVYALLAPWQKEGSRTAPPDVPDLLTTPA
jgi:hypothetical protein